MGQHDHGGTSPYQTSTMVRDTNMLQAVYLKESVEKREREAGSERERERERARERESGRKKRETEGERK